MSEMTMSESPSQVDAPLRASPMPCVAAIVTAAGLLGAAGIHAAAAIGHADHGATHIALFVLAAFVGSTAAVFALGARRGGAVAALVVCVGLIAAWVLSRTVGLPGIGRESVGAPDLIGAALHAVAALAAVVVLTARVRKPGGVNAVGASVGIAALLFAVPAMVSATGGHGHSHADSAGDALAGAHDHGASASGRDEAGSGTASDHVGHGDEQTVTSSSDHGHDGHATEQSGGSTIDGGLHVHGAVDCAPTPAEQAAAAEFVGEVEAYLAREASSVEAATSGGFASIGGGTPDTNRGLNGTWHYANDEHYGDGRVLDAEAPEMVIFGRQPDGAVVPIGVMFQLDGPDDVGPQPFGCIAAWHTHEQSIVPGEQAEVPMLHVWTVELANGPFDHQGSPEYACRYLDEPGIARGYLVEPPDCVAREASRAEIMTVLRAGGRGG